MNYLYVLGLMVSILISCQASSENDLDELRREVEQLKLDNENLVKEINQNKELPRISREFKLDNYTPVISNGEKGKTSSANTEAVTKENYNPRAFGDAVRAAAISSQSQNEYARAYAYDPAGN